ncbi:MAG: hypothetical protein ACF8CQ_23430 [Rhodopirellula sp. JB044]|uniref:hypothetical protein n=1 Tax=Rhodopirellula sp. JB044 TaxID=3342844 RepID=UPI00370CA1E8
MKTEEETPNAAGEETVTAVVFCRIYQPKRTVGTDVLKPIGEGGSVVQTVGRQ